MCRPIDSRTSHLMKGVPAINIYSILSSKPHNPHYLNRYITFIEQCQQKNVGYEELVENHHICPKANDMFPEYEDFRLHPWNKAPLTPRQHFIAHMILWKTFSVYSQTIAFNLMIPNENQKTSKIYHKLREDYHFELEKMKLIMSERAKATTRRMLEDGSHPFLRESLIQKNRERMETDNPMTKMKINKGSFKKGHKPVITEKRNKKISLSKIGEKNPNYGNKGSFDHINKVLIECCYCGIKTTKGNIARWHNENCKQKPK
jgi:hypothetical protein